MLSRGKRCHVEMFRRSKNRKKPIPRRTATFADTIGAFTEWDPTYRAPVGSSLSYMSGNIPRWGIDPYGPRVMYPGEGIHYDPRSSHTFRSNMPHPRILFDENDMDNMIVPVRTLTGLSPIPSDMPGSFIRAAGRPGQYHMPDTYNGRVRVEPNSMQYHPVDFFQERDNLTMKWHLRDLGLENPSSEQIQAALDAVPKDAFYPTGAGAPLVAPGYGYLDLARKYADGFEGAGTSRLREYDSLSRPGRSHSFSSNRPHRSFDHAQFRRSLGLHPDRVGTL